MSVATNHGSQWKEIGVCAPAAGMRSAPAVAGSDRVYYEHRETGQYCFRGAGHEAGGFRDRGNGAGCDENGKPNGLIYDESEF